MKFEDFDPVSSPLHKGVNLIEASAGTGKTYTIAMLVLRLVVELDIAVGKILVVTFTKAATEELKERIRRRLTEAKKLLLKRSEANDPALELWLSQLDLTPELIEQRLSMALLDIDQAGIYTIHAFCQRVLNEHALTSGQLFDANLTGDLASIRQTCADDFWRLEIQTRPAWQTSILTREYKTPDALLESIPALPEDSWILPEATDLTSALANFKQAYEVAAEAFSGALEALKPYCETSFFNSAFKTALLEVCASLASLDENIDHGILALDRFFLFTRENLINSLNGSQFRANKEHSQEERKAGFLAELNLDTHPFDNLQQSNRQVDIALRTRILTYLHAQLDKELERMKVWSFDSLISHLGKALRNDQDGHLADELRARYSAALIDEFQDTDNNQWHIFSSIFAVSSHFLLLVGDPKQAIYKFRGADIYSYLAAQKHAQQQFTLRRNWRSHPDLVFGINRLFQRDGIFLLPDISFKPAEAAMSVENGALYHNGKTVAPIELWQLPESDSSTGFWQTNRNEANELIAMNVVNEIVDLLTGDFRLQPNNRRLIPQDIAILVRTNKQARDYQDTLRLAGVPSVLTSTEPVYGTNEACNLYQLLEAVANPGDARQLGQALSLSWFGFNGAELNRLLHDEAAMDRIVSRFSGYHIIWQDKGLMPMVQALCAQENITTVLASTPSAERSLTNLQHLLELLQQAAIDGNLGVHKTLSHLKNEIHRTQTGGTNADSQQLRLESDADAVKIITMHRAKGLEFPVVFCPCLWQGGKSKRTKNDVVICHLPDPLLDSEYRTLADFGSALYERHAEQADFEAQAEEIRLAYVALTRAKFRCYIAWADSRSKEEANASALAKLLNFSAYTFAEQQALLLELTRLDSAAFAYRLLNKAPVLNGGYQAAPKPSNLQAKKRHRSLYSNWQMSSYTALSKLSLSDVPEIPTDKADEIEPPAHDINQALPAGAQTGNVVHELLETIPFAELGNKQDISLLRDKACQYYNLNLTQPGIIDELLYKAVCTPLSASDVYFCLKNIPDSRCLKEMPFYLGLSSVNTNAINRVLQNHAIFQGLSEKRLSGFLTGFIDLICEYKGQYYVMDYKTNALPDYEIMSLTQAMREHNYGLQYWLYCVVLHRYLQNRLPGYNYKQHFGGVRYLFVRGMQPDIPMSGVFQDRPPLSLIETLADLLKG